MLAKGKSMPINLLPKDQHFVDLLVDVHLDEPTFSDKQITLQYNRKSKEKIITSLKLPNCHYNLLKSLERLKNKDTSDITKIAQQEGIIIAGDILLYDNIPTEFWAVIIFIRSMSQLLRVEIKAITQYYFMLFTI